MKIYFHPMSTTSRMVWLGAEEMGVDAEYQVVDLTTGAHLKPPYSELNPSCLVPMLDDDGFRLTESSAILKYLGEKSGSPAYSGDIRRRARINEVMDWFNANLYKDFGYSLVYPQVFPHHRRRSDEAQAGTLAWGQEKSRRWLQVLDRSLLGGGQKYLCGDTPTIADYFAAPMVELGELIHCDWSAWANLASWTARIKQLRSWPKVSEAYAGFVASLSDRQFVHV